MQSQVLQLKEKKPDVVIMITYTSDAILFAKTMQALDYKPPMLHRRRLRLFRSVLHQGGRQDLARRVQPLVVERRTSGLADARSSPRCTRRRAATRWTTPPGVRCRPSSCCCDAIDRAGSTDPAKIQAALKATDLKPDQLMIGYKGVKFDDKGQNVLASGVMIQLQDGENYVAVWPKANAEKAPVMPYKGW